MITNSGSRRRARALKLVERRAEKRREKQGLIFHLIDPDLSDDEADLGNDGIIEDFERAHGETTDERPVVFSILATDHFWPNPRDLTESEWVKAAEQVAAELRDLTDAEIEMAENPKLAGIRGDDSRLVLQGHHTPADLGRGPYVGGAFDNVSEALLNMRPRGVDEPS